MKAVLLQHCLFWLPIYCIDSADETVLEKVFYFSSEAVSQCNRAPGAWGGPCGRGQSCCKPDLQPFNSLIHKVGGGFHKPRPLGSFAWVESEVLEMKVLVRFGRLVVLYEVDLRGLEIMFVTWFNDPTPDVLQLRLRRGFSCLWEAALST